MEEKKKKIFDQALKVIKNKEVVFMEDLISYLPIVKSTFYDYFPNGSNESNTIKEAIDKNKVDIKSELRNKWRFDNNATTQIALYKLLANESELDNLNSSRQKVEHSGEIQIKQITGMEIK